MRNEQYLKALSGVCDGRGPSLALPRRLVDDDEARHAAGRGGKGPVEGCEEGIARCQGLSLVGEVREVHVRAKRIGGLRGSGGLREARRGGGVADKGGGRCSGMLGPEHVGILGRTATRNVALVRRLHERSGTLGRSFRLGKLERM